jgi:uncharacterized membrane protein
MAGRTRVYIFFTKQMYRFFSICQIYSIYSAIFELIRISLPLNTISYLTSKVDNSFINIEAVYYDKEQKNLFMFLTRPIRAIFSFFLDNNIYINTKSSIFAETVVVSFIDVFFILGLVFLIKYVSVPEQPTK